MAKRIYTVKAVRTCFIDIEAKSYEDAIEKAHGIDWNEWEEIDDDKMVINVKDPS